MKACPVETQARDAEVFPIGVGTSGAQGFIIVISP